MIKTWTMTNMMTSMRWTLIIQHKHEIKQITKDIPTSETTKET